jgi:hypothetical protein
MMSQIDYSDEDTHDDEKLDQEYDTPLTNPRDDSGGFVAPDHPATDSGLDEHELYDEGLPTGAETDDREEGDIM